jgi:gamma-glutamylcyclotransferase (GGCT)/AIG2-like uncharacterized protein YtfP
MSKLYVAYGSNLNMMQMGWRCPTASVVGTGKIIDYKLTFRRVATIEPCVKKEVPVAVWTIEDSDEKALDRYEGYPHLYRKEMIDVEMDNGEKVNAMVYIMNYGEPAMPYKQYIDTIIKGYEDVGLDPSYLIEAIEDTKNRL